MDPMINSYGKNKGVKSYYPHLSPNRSLSEFRPYFEPNLNIENFFKEIQEIAFKQADFYLSGKA
jgi:hypothetical protein